MALNPPVKRKSGLGSNSHAANPAARKRAKTQDARTIAVQSSEAALSKTGELDVASFVAAREFEIRALEAGVRNSKAVNASRAFQKVPRHMRRRTASHNVKRVPRRLRARAKREMIEDNTPTVTARRRTPTQLLRLRIETARRLQGLNARTKKRRATAKGEESKKSDTVDRAEQTMEIAPRVPKIKKNKLSHAPTPVSKYKKRQRGKTWLPTHMFHAKRAHITEPREPLWRFAVPLSPTEKSYRPTHRAGGARGAVAWDMSYMSTIGVEGVEASVEGLLRGMGVAGDDAWGAKGKRWRQGTRGLEKWTFERDGDQRPLAPVTLIWRVENRPEDVEMVDADKSAAKAKKPKRKMFIRVHPSAFLQLWSELLKVAKIQKPPVLVEDLRFEIGSIEMTGPGSTEALLAALQPTAVTDDRELVEGSPERTWTSLAGVTNSSSLPQNALLAFDVVDSRLRFPPRSTKLPTSEDNLNNLAILLSAWSPDSTQSEASIFSRPARLAASRLLPSQKAVNRRRMLADPGEYPTTKPTDPKIPVMILATRPKINTKNGNSQGTWTVLLPWKCVVPVWYSIMYYPLSSGGNPRFGGLQEKQQLAFEAGEPWFPGDFPGTKAGWEWGIRESEMQKKEWERRPKGKRVEFSSLDLGNGNKGEIGHGWSCDWEKLVRLYLARKARPGSDADQDGKAKATSKESSKKESGSSAVPPFEIHQLPTGVAKSMLSSMSSASLAPDFQSLLTKPALATVKVSLLTRGTPVPRARIYRLPTSNPSLRSRWLAQVPRPQKTGRCEGGKKNAKNPSQPRSQGSDLAPSLVDETAGTGAGTEHDGSDPTYLPIPVEEDLIGFVTTGNYNLSEGKGTGVGAVLVQKVIQGENATAKRGGKADMQLCIIRAAGERVGRLGRWEAV